MSIILLVPSAAHARQLTAQLTVEAEYGAHVWEGTIYTAAHHQKDGPYAGRHLLAHAATGRPSPCNDPAIPVVEAGDGRGARKGDVLVINTTKCFIN